jgi:uncharacterized protein
MSDSNNETLITLHVQPSARKNEVVGYDGSVIRLKIAAPPVEGKANREVIAFLSQRLDIKKGALTIRRGLTSRDKVIAVDGLSRDEVLRRLSLKSLL